MTAAGLLRDTANWYEANPGLWTQGTGGFTQPKRCAYQALVGFGGGKEAPHVQGAVRALAEHIAGRELAEPWEPWEHATVVIDWNDTPRRTVEEVVPALRAAAGTFE